jgi:hypothetical protein
LDQSTFGCEDVGQNNVILTVTDREGNTDTAPAVITVEDNISPDLSSLPSPVTIEIDANGYAVMDPVYIGSFVDEACDFTTTFSVDSFDCDDVVIAPCWPFLVEVNGNLVPGDHVVDVTVVDASGNTSTTQIGVIVEDNTDPVANVFANINLYLDATGNATLDFEDHIDNGSFDNCSYVATFERDDLIGGRDFFCERCKYCSFSIRYVN